MHNMSVLYKNALTMSQFSSLSNNWSNILNMILYHTFQQCNLRKYFFLFSDYFIWYFAGMLEAAGGTIELFSSAAVVVCDRLLQLVPSRLSYTDILKKVL